MRDDWVAARRLSSAFHSGAADNFLSAVFEIDTTERWQAVALALVGDVSTLADLAHGGMPRTGLITAWRRCSTVGIGPNDPLRPPRNPHRCNTIHDCRWL